MLIVPMTRTHARHCDAIVAQSEPWKTLGDGIDFAGAIRHKIGHVCLKNDRLAGFLIITPDPVFARGGYLRAIGVDPEMRGQGIGRALLAFAEELTAARADFLYLCVSSFNRPAKHFYKKNGYARVGTLPGLVLPNTSEHIYWKRLQRTPRKTRK